MQCYTTRCAGKTKQDLRLCKKDCRSATKAACLADNTVCSGSASGAFVD
jgi:hypothetical protein